jgi:hypothetical protein
LAGEGEGEGGKGGTGGKKKVDIFRFSIYDARNILMFGREAKMAVQFVREEHRDLPAGPCAVS